MDEFDGTVVVCKALSVIDFLKYGKISIARE